MCVAIDALQSSLGLADGAQCPHLAQGSSEEKLLCAALSPAQLGHASSFTRARKSLPYQNADILKCTIKH